MYTCGVKTNITVLLALGFASVAVAAPTAAAGKTIYTANCAACHGAKGQGVTGLGLPLKTATAWKYDMFKRALLEGKNAKGVAMKPTMPKWTNGFAPNTGKKPTDDQMKSLQMYIKTLK